MDTTWVIVLCVVIALIAIGITVQTIRMSRSRLGKVMNVYRNIRFNEKLAGEFGYKGVKGRFHTRAWDDGKYGIDYLPEELRTDLNTLFEKIHELNLSIGSIVEGRGETTLTRINIDTVKQPLTDMRRRLDEWIKANSANPEFAPKRLGFLGL